LDISQAGYAMRAGLYPIDVMPALIHEAAHFDTFQTPVGHALAAVYLRAWTRAVRSERNDGSDPGASHYEGLVDFLRFKTVSEALRPLAEGLALFTEFDSIPLSSPVTTSQSFIAGVMCCGDLKEYDDSITVAELAFKTLSSARRERFFCARKENLLTQPLTTENGGYLPGYLLVKGILNLQLRYQQIDKLRDGDLFFWCIISIVFGDIKLARLIVDPALDLMFDTSPESIERDAVNAPLTRIQDRIISLITKLDENYVNRLESIVGSKEPWSWLQLQIDSADDELQDDVAVFGNEVNKIIDPDDQPTQLAAELAKTSRRIMRNRDLLCIASFDTSVRVTEHGLCLVGSGRFGESGLPVASFPVIKGTSGGSGQGSYELYLDRAKRMVCFSVTRGDVIVACGTLSDQKFDLEDFIVRSPSVRNMARIRAQMESDLSRNFSDQEDYKTVVESYTTQIPKMIDNIYMERVKAIFEEEYAGRIDPRIESDGITAIAGADLSIISNYSQLSILLGGVHTADRFADLCKILDLDPTKIKADLDAWRTQTAFPLVHEVKNIIFFTA
jgi:hypothetical protein